MTPARGPQPQHALCTSTPPLFLAVFNEPAVTLANTLRPTAEPSELASSLAKALAAADSRRAGALPPDTLRAALGAAFARAASAAAGVGSSAKGKAGANSAGGVGGGGGTGAAGTGAALVQHVIGDGELSPHELRLLSSLAYDPEGLGE